MLVLVIYDIPDDKRRTKLSNLLEGYGRRVQKSAFECFLSLEEMAILHERVAQKFVLEQEDNVRFYWVPRNSLTRSLTIGSAPPHPPPDSYVI
jgi:CRISPR-associated protein Cas2